MCVEILQSADVTNSIGEEPWAKSMFPFSADHPGELSFIDGITVKLRQKIDDNWFEGEVDGKVGIFPSNYVKVMVEVPEGYVPPKVSANPAKPDTLGIDDTTSSSNNNSLKPSNNNAASQWKNKKAKVLYDFKAESAQDLGVTSGQIVTIVEKVDDDWVEAKHPSGKVGFVPANYVKLIEKPSSPSVKRRAPPPPGASKGKAPSAPAAMDPLDIFSLGSKSNAPSAPKTNGSNMDDLFMLDPLGKDDVILQPQGSAPKNNPALPSAFKLGGGAFRPVSFPGKPEDIGMTSLSMCTLSVADGPNLLGSVRDLTDMSDVGSAPAFDVNKHILDITPVDEAPGGDILAPVLSPPPGSVPPMKLPSPETTDKTALLEKMDSVDSLSKYDVLATAQPFSVQSTKQVRSVASPTRSKGSTPTTPTKPEPGLTGKDKTTNGAETVTEEVDQAGMKAVMLTMDQVNQDLDKALVGETVNPCLEPVVSSPANPFSAENSSDFSDFRPPIPPRQPSPNPFAAAPLEAIPAPLEPVPAPLEPVSAPLEPTFAPLEPTFAPLEPVTAPLEPIPIRGTSESSDEALRVQPPAPAPSPANPFSLDSTPDSAPSSAEGVVNFFSQSQPQSSGASNIPPRPLRNDSVDSIQFSCSSIPSRLMRDDSVASEWSDDMPMQNINFAINPPSTQSFKIPTAIKLPPPPSPRRRDSELESQPVKPQPKFDPKTIRPRPRAGSLSSNEGDSPFFSETPEGVLSDDEIKKIAPDSDQFRKDLAAFQANVHDMFDTSDWDTSVGDEVFGSPATEEPEPLSMSMLDTEFDSTLTGRINWFFIFRIT